MNIKICGMREPENIKDVASLAPDFMGFIFYRDSPRWVGDDFEMPAELPGSIKKTGVFVNDELEEIRHRIRRFRLDAVQLHGNESPQQCDALKKSGCSVIKVFSIGPDFDFQSLAAYQHSVSFFLFDTKGKFHGGNGLPFDWEVLKNYHLPVPFFLSGGLGVDNVDAALAMKLPALAGLDLNSGVEISPGVKDVAKLAIISKRIEILKKSSPN